MLSPVPYKMKDDSIAMFLNAIQPLSKKALHVIIEHSYALSVKKGVLLVQPGDRDTQLFFLKKGVVRGYIKENKKEVTTWINEESEIVAAIRNYGLNIPSEEFLEALEDCEVTGISYSIIEYMYEHFPATNRIGRILLEENYRGAEERAYLCRINSASDRYNRLLQTRGSLVNRVPLKYIASYLNMNLETLSRLRKKNTRGSSRHVDPE